MSEPEQPPISCSVGSHQLQSTQQFSIPVKVVTIEQPSAADPSKIDVLQTDRESRTDSLLVTSLPSGFRDVSGETNE
jgi:hypothetical protein